MRQMMTKHGKPAGIDGEIMSIQWDGRRVRPENT